MNNGSAVFSVDIDVTRILTDGTEVTVAQFSDAMDSTVAIIPDLTIDHAESLNHFGVVLQDGETLRFTVNGESVADAGTVSHFDQASLRWLIGTADITRPRLVLY